MEKELTEEQVTEKLRQAIFLTSMQAAARITERFPALARKVPWMASVISSAIFELFNLEEKEPWEKNQKTG